MPDHDAQQTGLAWPDHDAGPTPPPEYRSRERDEDRATRKPLPLWDRTKFLLLLALIAMFLLSASITSNPPLQIQFLTDPLIGIADAIAQDRGTYLGLAALAALELLRQLHYLISEHWAGYHRFWTRSVFGRLDRRRGRMDDWTRFRVGRVGRLVFLLLVLNFVLAAVFDLPVATALFAAPGELLGVLPLALRLVFGFFFVIVQFVGLFWFLSRGGVDTYFPDDIKTRFTDVWGQDNVLEKIKENMVFLEEPEKIEARGGYVPAGILLWGPPGTGKTLMAEAVAGETGRPFMFIDPGAFQAMFMGVGILKVKSLFRKARKLALRYGGVILFFDEADSLGSRGISTQPQPGGGFWSEQAHAGCNGLSYLDPATASLVWRGGLADSTSAPEAPRRWRDGIIMGGMGGGGGMGTLNALLTELSGLKKPRGFWNRVVRRTLGMRPKPPPKYRILVMMATNLPQALDEALLRPGRIDRIYKVGYPAKPGRIRTYQGYFAKVAHELTEEEFDKLATITPYATGATMKDLVNESLINAIREGRETITWRDVVKAKQLKDLGPPEDVEYIERERHAVAVHEACHAVMAHRVRQHLTIDIATIEKGGTYLGMVASIPPEDQFTRWRSEYEADILVSLASLAGERMFFSGDNSSGVSGDLESATRVATMMEGFWGMGSTVTSHGVTRLAGIPGGTGEDDPESSLLKGALGARIERKLAELLARAEEILRDHRAEVLAVAHALESHKTVTGDDVRAIIEGHQGPLIDGRPYHTPEFLQAAEAYHAHVAEAHVRHAKVDEPLPLLPAPEFAGVLGDGAPPHNGSSSAVAVDPTEAP